MCVGSTGRQVGDGGVAARVGGGEGGGESQIVTEKAFALYYRLHFTVAPGRILGDLGEGFPSVQYTVEIWLPSFYHQNIP